MCSDLSEWSCSLLLGPCVPHQTNNWSPPVYSFSFLCLLNAVPGCRAKNIYLFILSKCLHRVIFYWWQKQHSEHRIHTSFCVVSFFLFLSVSKPNCLPSGVVYSSKQKGTMRNSKWTSAWWFVVHAVAVYLEHPVKRDLMCGGISRQHTPHQCAL